MQLFLHYLLTFLSLVSVAAGQNTFIAVLPADVQSFSSGRREYRIPLLLYYLLTFGSVSSSSGTEYTIPLLLYYLLTFGFSVAAGQNTGYLYCCITCLRSVFQWQQDRIRIPLLLLYLRC